MIHVARVGLSIVIASALAALPLTASARTDIPSTTVTRVYTNSSGDVLVRFASGQGGEGCTDENWARIATDRPQWRQMYELALAAQLSGDTVSVRLSGCSPYPVIAYLYIR